MMSEIQSSPENTVEVMLIHGTKKHMVTVASHTDTNTETQTNILVCDLAEAVFKATEVPVHLQKLIFKGKSLKTDSQQSLESVGIRNKAKVMLIGKKMLEDDEHTKLVNKIEKSAELTRKKQSDIEEEISGVEMGYLQADLIEDALKKQKKRLLACNEEFMKYLENLDSMNMNDIHQSIKNKRKKNVVLIQGLLDKTDTLITRIDNLKIRLGDS